MKTSSAVSLHRRSRKNASRENHMRGNWDESIPSNGNFRAPDTPWCSTFPWNLKLLTLNSSLQGRRILPQGKWIEGVFGIPLANPSNVKVGALTILMIWPDGNELNLPKPPTPRKMQKLIQLLGEVWETRCLSWMWKLKVGCWLENILKHVSFMQLKPPATLRLPGIYVWPPPWVKCPSPGGWDLTVSNGSGKSSRLRELAATCAFSNFVSARPLLKLHW